MKFDATLPRGLHKLDNDGNLGNHSISFSPEMRKINDRGEPDGNWTPLGDRTLSNNTSKPQRYSFGYTVPFGRYEVRFKRIGNKVDDARVADEIRWTGLKAVLFDTSNYEGLTLLAIKMKATDNLSNRSSRRINVDATRKLPTWEPIGGWGPNVATSSPIWALADMIRNSSYGAGWGDEKIDMQAFYDLDQILTSRGDSFNAVFDRKMSMWEAIRLVCRSVRSAGILQGGVFRIIRDRSQSIPVAMFSPRNIVKDSFSISYSMASEDTVDGVEVEFINPDTWKIDEVSANHNGETPSNPAKIKLFGCTNREQALREALYLSRNNIYRRKTITLTTELEGYIPTFGDLVAVSHDMPQWGTTGEVIGINSRGAIELSEPVEFQAGKRHYAAFRTKAGGVSGPWEVYDGTGEADEMALTGHWIFARSSESDYTIIENSRGDNMRLYYGTKEERTHFSFGVGDTWSQYGVVKSIRPRGDLKVELTILSEDNRVHGD